MSDGKFIDFQLGMKYDLSNSIKNCLINSFHEFKEQQILIRNYLLLRNMIEKEMKEKKKRQKYFRIYKIKEKKQIFLDNSEEEHIPQGYYCYPLKGAYFQKSSLEMPYFPILPFDKFKEAIETFPDQTNLSETYQSYPCLLEKDYNRIKNKIIQKYNNLYEHKPIFKDLYNEKKKNAIRPSHSTHNINKLFIIWSFIKIIKGQLVIMDKDLNRIYNIDKNKIIIPIIKEMNKYLKIDVNILYYIINRFLNDLSKKLNKETLKQRGITYKKYEKYWCRICNKFCCAFHFKVKIKPKTLDNNNIRTYVEYFKKIQIIMKPPEYLFKEKEENDTNRTKLKKIINKILEECECKKKLHESDNSQIENNVIEISENDNIQNINNTQISILNEDFNFDPSIRFNKMAEIIIKEDFFLLCKIVKTCHKLLCKKFDGLYNNNQIFNFYLTPCVLRRILHNQYDCHLLQYLIKLIIEDKYLQDINLFLTSSFGDKIIYENLKEENYLFFNNTNEFNTQAPKYNEKGEQKLSTTFTRTKATARLQVHSDKNLYYKPCDHYPSICSPDNCPCAKRGICLKYCCCYKETLINVDKDRCVYMFIGCPHNKYQNKAKCKDCFCKKSNIECVPGLCKCGEKCTNNNITLGRRKKLLFGYSEAIKGGGLFAGEKIYEGEYIDSYDGEIVETEELDRLSVFFDQIGNNYPFSINDKFDFVTIKCGGLTRYINHGSHGEQNINADKIMVNGISYIAFYASRDIDKYEELFYDYSYDDNSMPQWMREYNKMMEIKKQREEEIKRYNENKFKRYHSKTKGAKRNYEKNNNNDSNQKISKSGIIKLNEDEEDF